MKKHKDLLSYLKAKGLRATNAKKALLQFFLDREGKNIDPSELALFVEKELPNVDRTTIYRNLDKFIELEVIQKLKLQEKKTVYQYIFDRKVHHYFICKSCGKAAKGNEEFFKKVEKALREVHGFSKANLSVVFYGFCSKCERRDHLTDL